MKNCILLLFVFVMIVLDTGVNAFAAPCDFRRLKLKKSDGPVGVFTIDKKTSLSVEGKQGDKDIFNGPVALMTGGNKKCQFEGGNFTGFYVSRSKKYLLTESVTGSCVSNVTVDMKSCALAKSRAEYCGPAKFEKQKLVNHAYCEPISDTLANCSSAHVYRFQGKDCVIALDEAASVAMTKKELGMELPLTDTYYVQHPRTPDAKRVK